MKKKLKNEIGGGGSDWRITVTFPEMPPDADEKSMRTFIINLLSSSSEVEFTVDKIERLLSE